MKYILVFLLAVFLCITPFIYQAQAFPGPEEESRVSRAKPHSDVGNNQEEKSKKDVERKNSSSLEEEEKEDNFVYGFGLFGVVEAVWSALLLYLAKP